ncbi:MAG: hypothetical protein RLZZ46_319, partial [Bacteroidota bacterium]
MLKKFITALLQLTCVTTFAQSDDMSCFYLPPQPSWENQFQKLIEEYVSKNNSIRTGNVTIVPIVFHVIHGGEQIGIYPNIQAGQIQAQITVLNEDFSANAYNVADYPINAFVNWASDQSLPFNNLDTLGRVKIADFEIQFCPARIDTSGNLMSEPGIDRINYQDKGWPTPSTFTTQSSMRAYLDSIVKPQSIWDVTKYLNVWITDKSNQLTYGGVSSVPPLSGLPDILNGATATTDGIWCFTKVIGSNTLFPQGDYVSPFIDGRTLTHEAGHYFGLRHIWGDNNCGNDFCNDTPPAASENTGNPNYPVNPGSCQNPSNLPDGEMFMNYMDYTIGPAKYMFTTDQKIRARTALLNSPFRNQLGSHGICENNMSLNPVVDDQDFMVYPNPAYDKISIRGRNIKNNKIKIYNIQGVLMRESNSTELMIGDLSS